MHWVTKSDWHRGGNGPAAGGKSGRGRQVATGDMPTFTEASLRHFIFRRAFLYPRHIPKSDHRFGPSARAPGHKALVFFGRSR